MTVLSVIQDVCLAVGVTRPDQVFSSTAREHQELASLARECAKMIAYDSGHDWTKLKTIGTFTGDGATGSFDLPADFYRLLRRASMWPSATPSMPYNFIADTDQWFGALQGGFGLIGAWTMIGEQVHIRVGGSTGYLGNTNTAQFYYLTSNYAKDLAGVLKADFTADDDTFRLNERLLKLALIYRWKQDKGTDYSEALSDFQNTLFEQIGNDGGSKLITVGGRGSFPGVTTAYPWQLG